MPRWVFWGAIGFTLVVGCAGLVAWDQIMLRTATASDGKLGVWVYTPYVGPGETLVTTVGVYGGLKAGIRGVTVHAGDEVVRVRGEGADWGSRISTKSTSRGSDSIDVLLEVPADSEGSLVPLRFDVSYVVASSRGSSSFVNSDRSASVHMGLPVYSASERAVRRAVAAGGALLALVLACLGGVPIMSWLAANNDSTSEDDAEALVGAIVIGAMAYGLLGYWAFALPIVAATHVTSGWFVAALVIAWLVVPTFVAYKIGDAVGSEPSQVLVLERGVDVDPWLDRLEHRRLQVRRFPGIVRIADGDEVLWVRPHQLRSGGTVRFYGASEPLGIRLALLLVPVVGPVVLTTHGFSATIDEDATRESVDADLSERRRIALESMAALLEQTSAIMDSFFKGEEPPPPSERP